jgi:hypothetical protein
MGVLGLAEIRLAVEQVNNHGHGYLAPRASGGKLPLDDKIVFSHKRFLCMI